MQGLGFWCSSIFFFTSQATVKGYQDMKLDNQKERDHMENQDIDGMIVLVNHTELCIDMKQFIWPVTRSWEHNQRALGSNTKQEIC
jgi:hypothetical protein